ncbi:hypothetical protein D477_006266 [Arthrobacter crystallopoietes BAB-32]|uniref:Uncharacterized protein n=1 Tax=Arthrobacter crystallopoietes BAB-32 TaxID=1246476 RepID=N1UXG2_9MICC|nr:hypothetical protein [Arthrobacter crystallopoietes]EMY35086.1 hypothetical protein D477_006266 [Arthrobacter crystallopoietes BAB-32]
MGLRIAKSAAVTARVCIAAGLGALGWTLLTTTTANAADAEPPGSLPTDAVVQVLEDSTAELTQPLAEPLASAGAAAGAGAAKTAETVDRTAPVDVAPVRGLGSIVEAPVAKTVDAVAPVVEAVATDAAVVVNGLDTVVQEVDATGQELGLPAVLPEKPVETATGIVAGQVGNAVETVTAPVDAVTEPVGIKVPVGEVLEPVTAPRVEAPETAKPASPAPSVPVGGPSEPASEQPQVPSAHVSEPAPGTAAPGTDSPGVPTQPASAAETRLDGNDASSQGVLSSGEPSPGLLSLLELPGVAAPALTTAEGGAELARTAPVPAPADSPLGSPAIPAASGGSAGGSGGGSGGNASADAFLADGPNLVLASKLTRTADSSVLPAAPAFDPGCTPD